MQYSLVSDTSMEIDNDRIVPLDFHPDALDTDALVTDALGLKPISISEQDILGNIYIQPVHNNDNCKSTYLVDLTHKKNGPQHKKEVSRTWPITETIQIRNDSSIFATSQNLLLINGKLNRFNLNWTDNKDIYTNLATAARDLNANAIVKLNLPELLPLPPIKQGYLASLLKLHRKGLHVAPLYNLDKEWRQLLDLHYALTVAPVDVQITLIKYGILSYFDANKHLIKSLIIGHWENVRRILKHYGGKRKGLITLTYKDINNLIIHDINIPTDVLNTLVESLHPQILRK